MALNADYKFSPTYPAVFYVPSIVPDPVLHKVAAFRKQARIPVLAYYCSSSGAAMLRSAQPRTGFTGNICVADEQLIAAAKIRFIIDCRPKINARGNKVLGGGFESAARYRDCQLVFMGIENIHAVRDSFRAMVIPLALHSSTVRRLSVGQMESPALFTEAKRYSVENDEIMTPIGLNPSEWHKHLSQILVAAVFTAAKVSEDCVSVLVHCSDGWDRTAQVTSLAMLLMDPYYRTIAGFAVLIEKEWIGFGHKFSQRVGHGNANFSDQQISPIFLQFLDVVWQVQSQYPSAFEFSPELLFCIAQEHYDCKFGTFLGNNDRQRAQARIKSKTVSLWTYVLQARETFINPLYQVSYQGTRCCPGNCPLARLTDRTT